MAETRDILRHLFNIGTATTPQYVLLGNGITELTEEFNAESDTTQYIHEQNGTTTTKSYTPSIAVTKQYIVDEDLQEWLDDKVDTLPVGSSAETDYIRFNLRRKSGDGYIAIKRKCSYQIDSIGGSAGENLETGFTIGGIGDGVTGVVKIDETTGVYTFVAD